MALTGGLVWPTSKVISVGAPLTQLPIVFVCGMVIVNRMMIKRFMIACRFDLLAFLVSQSVAFFRGFKINCGCLGVGSHEVGLLSIAFTSACLMCNL